MREHLFRSFKNLKISGTFNRVSKFDIVEKFLFHQKSPTIVHQRVHAQMAENYLIEKDKFLILPIPPSKYALCPWSHKAMPDILILVLFKYFAKKMVHLFKLYITNKKYSPNLFSTSSQNIQSLFCVAV